MAVGGVAMQKKVKSLNDSQRSEQTSVPLTPGGIPLPSTDLHQPNYENMDRQTPGDGRVGCRRDSGHCRTGLPHSKSRQPPFCVKSHENSHTTRWCFKKSPMNTPLHQLNRLPTLSWILPKCSMSRYLPTHASKRRREK